MARFAGLEEPLDPDPDDPAADYWAWLDGQPHPPDVPSGQLPREVVTIDVDADGLLVSGPLCDAVTGKEIAP